MAIRHHLELTGASLLKLSSFMFWSWLYLWIAAVLPGQKPEWYSRVVTLLHGSIAAAVGLIQCDFRNISPARLSATVTTYQYALMVWSWGYFAMDFCWCLVYWSENLVMLVHHLGAIYAVDIYMRKENSGCTFACTLALMEITNPLLQTRWLIKQEGLEKSLYFLIVEVTYLVMFIVVRACIGSYVVYKILGSDLFGYDEKLITLVFFFVSWAFMYEIFGYVRYKYRNRKEPATTLAQIPSATAPPIAYTTQQDKVVVQTVHVLQQRQLECTDSK
ncbi:TLC domain-containing protein 5-like isoform X2 [Plodia interpunctella]|nr:TLC domain-containing protein 5-like isoform X2 [Plodia interpunctella]